MPLGVLLSVRPSKSSYITLPSFTIPSFERHLPTHVFIPKFANQSREPTRLEWLPLMLPLSVGLDA